ncbi:MAG: pilin [Candidatus Paceibacterota bacterium]
MKKKFIVLSSLGMVLAPFLAFAQCSTTTGDAEAVICKIGSILNTLVPVLIALAVVYFIWGVVQYVISSDEEAKKSGKMRMIWGIIGLVVIVGVWGLVGIVTNTFGIDNSPIPVIDIVPQS